MPGTERRISESRRRDWSLVGPLKHLSRRWCLRIQDFVQSLSTSLVRIVPTSFNCVLNCRAKQREDKHDTRGRRLLCSSWPGYMRRADGQKLGSIGLTNVGRYIPTNQLTSVHLLKVVYISTSNWRDGVWSTWLTGGINGVTAMLTGYGKNKLNVPISACKFDYSTEAAHFTSCYRGEYTFLLVIRVDSAPLAKHLGDGIHLVYMGNLG